MVIALLQPGKLSALEKTLLVLECAVQGGHFSQIAEATGLPIATVHRILSELVSSEWLFQDKQKTYRPGPRAYRFAAELGDAAQVASLVQPHLALLSSQTGLTAHFGLLQGDQVVYVAKVDAPKPYRMKSRVGGTIPLYSTAIGKAILATMSDEEVAASLARTGLERITPRTARSLEQLLTELEQIRRVGWALDDEENEEGLRCVGAAICGPSQVAMGISVTGLVHEVDKGALGTIAAQVQQAVSLISKELSGGGRRDELPPRL